MLETLFFHRLRPILTAVALLLATGVEADELDRIIAVVDEDIVMQSELDEQAARVRDALRQQHTEMPPTTVLNVFSSSGKRSRKSRQRLMHSAQS